MPKVTFDTPDGEDIEVDSAEVVHISAGDEPETTMIELEDGDEIIVAATQLEVAAQLDLNPLEYIDPEDDDESIERMVDEDDDPDA